MKITFLGNFQVYFSSETHHMKTLESLGHTVIPLQEADTPAHVVLDWALNSDLFIWVHTHGWQTPGTMSMVEVLENLKANGVPSMTYHLDLWFGLQRQQDLDNDPFYKHIGHFFTVDKLMADWFNENTEVKGHYIRAGVFDDECFMSEPLSKPDYYHDVIFVGSKGYHPEWPWRPQLIDFLQETYGNRFAHYGGDGRGIIRGSDLNRLYADTKVVVGDSLVLGFDYPYYWSDRVYETTGRGGFLLMPKIKGLETEFAYNEEIGVFDFGDFDGLKKQIDFYVANDQLRETMRQKGFNRTKNNYTYSHRWQAIIKELGL